MAVTLTNSDSSIIFNSGASQIRISKRRGIVVKDIGNNVRVEWGESGQYIEYNFADFSAPSGATAAAVANSIEAFLDTADTNIGITGANISDSVAITRAANTTTYAVNDVMNSGTDTTPLVFTVARANDVRGWIVGGVAVSNANQATLPNIDCLLFSSTFTIAADNLAFAPTYAQMQTYLGKIRFSTWVARGVRADSDGAVEQPFIFVPGTGTSDIYGVLVMQNAYIPISEETLQFTIFAERY